MDIAKDFPGYTQAQYLESVRNTITMRLLNKVDSAKSDECKIALLKVAKAYLEGNPLTAKERCMIT